MGRDRTPKFPPADACRSPTESVDRNCNCFLGAFSLVFALHVESADRNKICWLALCAAPLARGVGRKYVAPEKGGRH